MATTKIKPIRTHSHVSTAIRYATEDKIDLDDSSVIHKTLTTYINTQHYETAKEWDLVRKSFGQDNGKLAFQLIQNFGEGIDPLLANKIGVEFAKEILGNRQIIVATHTNTAYTHNHILFNSPDLETGKKYYDNKESYYNLVRKISDKLCEKYGLRVLEDTREGSLCFYKDSKGKTRYFEPTERKANMDYNSRCAQIEVWRAEEKRQKSKTLDIINDMEIIIPLSKSYEDFLRKMQNIGYRIKSKTSSGEWRKYITYLPPNSPEGARGYRDSNKLLAGYSREEITLRIAALQKEKQYEQTDVDVVVDNTHREHKIYTYDDVDTLSEEFRYNGSRRNVIDKIIASEVKKLNQELSADFVSAFKRNRQIPMAANLNRKDAEALKKINANLNTLSFIEKANVDTFEILQSRMKNALDKRDEVAAELKGAKNKLSTANELVACISKVKDYEAHILKQQAIYGDAYMELEKTSEIELYNAMQKKLSAAGLETEAERQSFLSRMEIYKSDYKQLVAAVQNISEELYSLDDVYRGINSIPAAQGAYEAELKAYQNERFKYENDRSQSNREYQNIRER